MLSTQININIQCDGLAYNFQRDGNENLKNFFNFFASSIGMAPNLIVLLYNGTALKGEDFKKTIWKTMNNADKQSKKMHIVAIKIDPEQSQHPPGPNDINILLIINEKKATRIRGEKGEPIKNIIQRAKIGKNKNYMKLPFNLRNQKIDLNKKFDDLANESDKQEKELILKIDDININNKENINVLPNLINTNNNVNIKVNFYYEKIGIKSLNCPPQQKLDEIFDQYCEENNLDKQKLRFLTRNNECIKYQESISDLYNRIGNGQNVDTTNNFIMDNSFMGNNQINIVNPAKEVNIKVSYFNDSGNEVPCYKKYKKYLIIGGIILGIIIIAAVIIIAVVATKSKDKDKSSSSTSNPSSTDESPLTCDSGYFIPEDDSTCQKCSLDGCVSCSGTSNSNTCTDCGNFKTVKEGDKIIRCNDPNKPCEEGEDDKCLTCDKESNECKDCNFAYKLVSGICRPDYFIKAVYLTKQDEDKIDIINDYTDVTHLYVEGNKITPSSKSYQFQKEGLQTVYFQFEDIYY